MSSYIADGSGCLQPACLMPIIHVGMSHLLCETTDQSALSDQLFKGPSKCQLQLTGEGQYEEIL